MSEHTPGPWEVTISHLVAKRMPDGTAKRICECTIGSEAEANARLIATAPDLLAASRSTVLRLADLPHWLEANGAKVLSAIVAEELAKHRAVIAKADPTA